MSNPVVKEEQTKLTERMVLTATELGISVVQTIAAETLKTKPGLSLRDFTHILDTFASKSKEAVSTGLGIKDI
jgi:hypothetical protein